MKYSEAEQGRTFVIRLEDGEVLHEVIEKFAADLGIERAFLIAVGGAGPGSTLVVGPEDKDARPVSPLTHVLDDVHEIAGVGTLFPDSGGRPMLHLHLACGREDHTVTGCGRTGVRTWQVAEVILVELLGTSARRETDPDTGFELLQP
ncbi:MAG: PPC domain-containing DNA-binding protein [PVC group bacterium]